MGTWRARRFWVREISAAAAAAASASSSMQRGVEEGEERPWEVGGGTLGTARAHTFGTGGDFTAW